MEKFFFLAALLIYTVSFPQTWQKGSIKPYNFSDVCIDNNDVMYTSYTYAYENVSLLFASNDMGEHWKIVRTFPYKEATMDYHFITMINRLYINGKNELVIYYGDSLYISADCGNTFNDTSYFPQREAGDYLFGFNKNIFFSRADYSSDGGHTFNPFPENDSLYKRVYYLDGLGNIYSPISGKCYKWRLDDSVICISPAPTYVDSLGRIIKTGIEVVDDELREYCRYYIGTPFQQYLDIGGPDQEIGASQTFYEDIFTAGNGLYRTTIDSIPDFYTDSLGTKYPKYELKRTLLTNQFNGTTNPPAFISKAKNGSLFAMDFRALHDAHLRRSDDNGYTWNIVPYKIDHQQMKVLLGAAKNQVYIGTAGNGLYLGTDVKSLLPDISFLHYVNIKNFVYDNKYKYILAKKYNSGFKIYKQDIPPKDYNEYSPLNLNGLEPQIIAAAKSIIAFTADSNTVYASINGGEFKELVSKSELSIPETSKITGLFAEENKIVIATNDPVDMTAFATFNLEGTRTNLEIWDASKNISRFVKDKKGNIYAGGDAEFIYNRSAETGSWNRLPFEVKKTYALAVDSADILYAAVLKQTGNMKYSVLYYSKDNGASWEQFNSPIDSISAEEPDSILLAINDIAATKSYIFAATDDGIYSAASIGYIIRNEDDKAPIAKNFALAQNYPNPFNPSTVISYDIPEASRVTLKVYDILGREVADLVNEFKEAGRYNVKFDASHLSTGIYIYQLRANDYVSVKKMSFIK